METSVMPTLLGLSGMLAEVFVSGLWQGAALLLLVALGLRLLPRAGATMRFLAWGGAFCLAMLLPLAEMHWHAAQGIGTNAAMFHAGMMPAMLIAVLWIGAALLRVAQLVIGGLHLRRLWRRATPVATSDAMRELLEASGRRRTQLCRSDDVDAPCVIGFRSPRLLLPAAMLETTPEQELRQIALHECEHLRRGDDWVNLLQKIGIALMPLNPALLWMDRRLGLERELACDAGVVAATEAPLDYASCLTRLAEERMGSRRAALALSAWGRRPELVERVHSLLRPMHRMSRAQMAATMAVLGGLLTGGAVELTRVPQLVSFAAMPAAGAVSAAMTARTDDAGAATAIPVRFSRGTAGATMVDAVARDSFPVRQTALTLPRKAAPPTQPPTSLKATAYIAERAGAAVPSGRREQAPPTLLRSVARARTGSSRPFAMLTATRQEQHAAAWQDLATAAGARSAASHAILLAPAGESAPEFRPSYAAIPLGDGWLIVQL